MITEQFNKKKLAIFKALDAIRAKGILPVVIPDNEIIEDDLISLHKKIDAQSFIISVCGQIKAGKSAFLNNILFQGEAVLPEDPVPWTAKLTKIQFRESPGYTVTYYSAEEWEQLRMLVSLDPETQEETRYYDEYIKAAVEDAATQGVYDVNVIKSPALKENHSDFNSLEDYVSAEGKYQPFVACLDLYTNNPDFRDVVIVDTPGLNDPNEFRSNLTVDWIIQSSAVVYLFNAIRALEREDLKFIDRHLLSIPSEKIVFALSKSDLIPSVDRVKQYVEVNLRNLKELKDRKLLEESGVYPISVYASNIKHKLESGLELNEEETQHYNRIMRDGRSDLLDSYGNIPELKEAIEGQLMADKGGALISKGKMTIDAVLDGKRRQLLLEAERIEALISAVNQDEETLISQKQSINELRNQLREKTRKFDQRLLHELTSIKNSLTDHIDLFIDNARDQVTLWVESNMQDIARLMQLSSTQIKSAIRTHYRDFRRNFLTPQITMKIENLVDKYKAEIREISEDVLDISTETIFSPTPKFRELLDEAMQDAQNVSPDLLESCRTRVLKILWTDKTETANNILGILLETIDEVRGNMHNNFDNHLDAEVTTYTDSVKHSVMTHVNQRGEDIQTLIDQIGEKEKLKEEYSTQSENNVLARDKLKELEESVREILRGV